MKKQWKRAVMVFWLFLLPSVGFANDLDFGLNSTPGPGEDPALTITPDAAVEELFVEITAGAYTKAHELRGLSAGELVRLSWPRNESVTSAEAAIRVIFADGFAKHLTVPISYSFSAPLSVSLDRAEADVAERLLRVDVTAQVERAEIKAYGAGKALLDARTEEIHAGPGRIEVPWVGDPADVVLLDVTLHSASAWAGFTYSPWFLNIPHEDVLFETNSDVIASDEEWKLDRTLEQLQEVLDQYGDLVPVKLYIAGCTDTVGDKGHNRDLSHRRARAIATWLQQHGAAMPIFYYGFGEGLLAIETGDGVDEAGNRRALYMVGANPPPSGSGIPFVRWNAL